MKFNPDDFPVFSKFNHHKLTKILKECSFQLFLKDETIDVPFGIIIMTGLRKNNLFLVFFIFFNFTEILIFSNLNITGEAKKIEDHSPGIRYISRLKFYVDGAHDQGIIFTQVDFFLIFFQKYFFLEYFAFQFFEKSEKIVRFF